MLIELINPEPILADGSSDATGGRDGTMMTFSGQNPLSFWLPRHALTRWRATAAWKERSLADTQSDDAGGRQFGSDDRSVGRAPEANNCLQVLWDIVAGGVYGQGLEGNMRPAYAWLGELGGGELVGRYGDPRMLVRLQ
ncbi:MAG: hypothetical protein ACK5YW_17815 [Betaproteobacteria bacterium]|jgi:hypothetical protein|nr:hypothetical protein [Rhodocyclaceae bacterium]MCE2899429.1 hypothetical protein [Betaproteobacteria bacterium]